MRRQAEASQTSRVAVVGAQGRVGRALVAAVLDHPHYVLAAQVVRSLEAFPSSTPLAEVSPVVTSLDDLASCDLDAVIDFSTADAVARHAAQIERLGCPWMIGVTGLSPDTHTMLRLLGQTVPVLYAPNTSPAMAVMMLLVEQAAHSLGVTVDCDIHDLHRRDKKDAPSGTALALKDAAQRGFVASAPQGLAPPIPVHSSRGGDALGAHDVAFYGHGEILRLSHAVHDRAVYAQGALRATEWLIEKKVPGFYSILDVYAPKRPR